MCLAQGHNAVPPARLDLESNTLPLTHCAPYIKISSFASVMEFFVRKEFIVISL